MRKKLFLMLTCCMAVSLSACGTGNEATTSETTVEQTPVVEEQVEEQVVDTTSEDVTIDSEVEDSQDVTEESDVRMTAQGFIGDSCADLINEIGMAESVHPNASADDNGMYGGYLHYADFEVEFASEDESFLENGNYSNCTVIAIVDPMFDN
ncbi:MAG: hypothetical protein K6G04_02125 [Lachnospiraceae bacterium]|nr:hypothetical protein [Lachnospiraceae bacterium]